MAHIALPRRSLNKPPVGAQINWGHPSAAGLLNFWAANEGGGATVRDLVKSRDASVLSGSPAASWSAGGFGGSALLFTAAAGSGLAPLSPSYNCFDGLSAFTALAWVKPTAASVADATNVYSPMARWAAGSASGQNFLWRQSNGLMQCFIRDSGATQYGGSLSQTLTAGVWQQIAVTWDGGTLKGYLNGLASGTQSTAGSTGSMQAIGGGFPIVLGGRGAASDSDATWDGLIDHWIVWSRALSGAELQQLYADPFALLLSPKPRRPYPPPPSVVSGVSLPFPRRRSVTLKPAAPQANPSHPLTQGLVGWWMLGEGGNTTAADLSGRNNKGAFQGTPSWVPGQFGPALSLNGSTDYLKVTAGGSLDITSGAITVAAWVKPTASLSTGAIVAKRDAGGGNINYYFGVNSDGTMQLNTSGPADTSSSVVTAGAWQHIAATFDGSMKKFYRNGSFVSSVGRGDPMVANSSNLNVGSYADGSGNFFNGLLDDVRLYGRTLGASEIQQLWQAPFQNLLPTRRFVAAPPQTPQVAARVLRARPVQRKPQPGAQLNPSHPLAQGLVDAWLFNEGGGANFYSLTGKNNLASGSNVITWPAGNFAGPSTQYDGSNAFAYKDSPSFLADTKGTFASWFKLASTTTGQIALSLSFPSGFTDEFFLLYYRGDSAGEFAVGVIKSGATNMYLDTSASYFLSDKNWHHYALTSDGSSLKLYIDGIPRTLSNQVGSNTGQWLGFTSAATRFTAGELIRNSGAVVPFSGQLDHAAYWNRALSAAEVQQLYTDPFCFLLQPRRLFTSSPLATHLPDKWFSPITQRPVEKYEVVSY